MFEAPAADAREPPPPKSRAKALMHATRLASRAVHLSPRSKLRAVLAKAPEHRTNDDLVLLRPYVEGCKEFAALGEDAKLKLCRVLRYEQRDKFEPVFLCGDFGERFYLILSGTVEVFPLLFFDHRLGACRQRTPMGRAPDLKGS